MDNAAARDNFVSGLYEQAVSAEKENILTRLIEPELADLHRQAAIHIHDLEGYRYVYNCCTPILKDVLDTERFSATNDFFRIVELFEKLKGLITELAVCQTGGIGFANFDGDLAETLEKLHVECSPENQMAMHEAAVQFIHWINITRTRYCREPYYLSLNIGLAASPWGRCIAHSVLQAYSKQPMEMTRPNIIFKVKAEINESSTAPNHDLFLLALRSTAKRMNPTYLLMDSSVNSKCLPEHLGIMGCRTRVYQNSNGPETTVGRGNIAYVSINLPRLALSSASIKAFFEKLEETSEKCKTILLNRLSTLQHSMKLDFIFQNRLWQNTGNMQALVKQGTLSLGFIGLSETIEILRKEQLHESADAENLGLEIVKTLRKFADRFRLETGFNFSLLATPGEMISGRFAEADFKKFGHPVSEKGFYTNSFHVPVDSGISIYKKLEIEGKFHDLCNGGSISYVEFRDAPMENIAALADVVSYAAEQGVSYLGFNFPLDICRKCGHQGTFDSCPNCGSNDIKRIRRVSGYLEDLNYFTSGKKHEVASRKSNAVSKESPQNHSA